MRNIIIVDANVALHYKRIDQIDWLALIDESSCEVAIVPQLMVELERKKIFGSSNTIRKRASRYIDYLVKLMDQTDPIKIRTNTNVLFIDHEPVIDFESENLSRDIGDDRFIASGIELKTAETKIWLASQDGGIALKLRHRPLQVLRLPDEYKLEGELDPVVKELREAKAELERLKNARPSLRVSFEEQKSIWSDEVSPNSEEHADEDRASIDRIRESYPAPPKPMPIANTQPQFSKFAESAYENKIRDWKEDLRERDVFFENYSRYLADRRIWLEKFRRVFEVRVELHNDGLASASHVDLKLFAPDGVKFLKWEDFEKSPNPPERPKRRSWAAELTNPRINRHLLPHRELKMPQDGDVDFSSSRKIAAFKIKVMKPKCLFKLEKFCILIEPELIGKTFQISTEITYAEGEPIPSELPVRTSEAKQART